MAVLQLNSVKDTTLWKRLNLGFSGADGDLAKHLSVYVEDTCKEAQDRMRNFASLHPQYTLHDEVHLLRVTELMARILPASVADMLNPIEIALLILSAHFHDQGMVLERDELISLDSNQEFRIFRDNWEIEHPNIRDVRERIRDRNLSEEEQHRLRDTEHELQAALLTHFIRITHAERSAHFVRTQYSHDPRWVINETNISELVARLCLSHVRPATDLVPTNGFRFDESVGPYRVNMTYIGLILRLADILDLDRDRTPDSLYRTINFRSGVSLREWEKHRSVDGWVIEPTLIQFTMRCEHPEYQRAAYQFMDLIDKELADAQYIIRNFPAQVAHYKLELPIAVDRSRIEPKDDSYIYRDLEFSLSRDEIVKLLMTSKLYGAPWICVRELLQNSLDALRYRKALIKRDNGTNWEHGIVEFHHDIDAYGHEVVRCIDNGAGMDKHIIERFLTNAGRSYYRSPEFEQERASFRSTGMDFDPCAQFGIGFMSCFMLGDNITIHTRRDYGPNRGQGEPLIVEISGLGGIVVIRKGQDNQAIGTTITITGRRKPRFIDVFEDKVKLLEVIEGYALACEFPIRAECTIPEIAGSVTVPPEVAIHRTLLEETSLQKYITLKQEFSEIYPSLGGYVKASFIVDDANQFTLANSEAAWEVVAEGNLQYIELKSSDGKRIERHFNSRENQLCMDGILVAGKPGRDDVWDERYSTIGYEGAPFELGRSFYLLDIRGEIKPPLTPARTIPDSRSILGYGPRWRYISNIIHKAQGRLWEKVAEQLSKGLSPEIFWQLAIIYYKYDREMYWMRAGTIWTLLSLPVLYSDSHYEWKNFQSLGLIQPVKSEELVLQKPHSDGLQLICADNGYIGVYDELTRWKESYQDRLERDLNNLVITMSTMTIEGNSPRLELRPPSQPDLAPWEFTIPGDTKLVFALPHSGEIKEYYSVHLPFKSVNREHPLVTQALNAEYLEQPSPLQDFALKAAYALSDSKFTEILINTELLAKRWHKYVGSKFLDIDWQTISYELHPPYKLLLEDGTTLDVNAEDFERWANATVLED